MKNEKGEEMEFINVKFGSAIIKLNQVLEVMAENFPDPVHPDVKGCFDDLISCSFILQDKLKKYIKYIKK